jgi:hypothetical protein
VYINGTIHNLLRCVHSGFSVLLYFLGTLWLYIELGAWFVKNVHAKFGPLGWLFYNLLFLVLVLVTLVASLVVAILRVGFRSG